MDLTNQKQNERDFANWGESASGGRIYWFDVIGRNGGKARYIKEVDRNEVTIAFTQEIYNSNEVLIQIHEKFPVDKGHKKVE